MASDCSTEVTGSLPVCPVMRKKIARIANGLQHLLEINLMPYHPLGESKSAHLGKEPLFTGDFAEKKDLESFRRIIQVQVTVPFNFS